MPALRLIAAFSAAIRQRMNTYWQNNVSAYFSTPADFRHAKLLLLRCCLRRAEILFACLHAYDAAAER